MGIAMIRKRLFDDLDAIARARNKAIIHNSNVARCVELPFFQKKRGRDHARGPRKYPLLKARLRAFRHCTPAP